MFYVCVFLPSPANTNIVTEAERTAPREYTENLNLSREKIELPR